MGPRDKRPAGVGRGLVRVREVHRRAPAVVLHQLPRAVDWVLTVAGLKLPLYLPPLISLAIANVLSSCVGSAPSISPRVVSLQSPGRGFCVCLQDPD